MQTNRVEGFRIWYVGFKTFKTTFNLEVLAAKFRGSDPNPRWLEGAVE